jgi:DNA-directed RNA polymerase specialized sigma24 family protein
MEHDNDSRRLLERYAQPAFALALFLVFERDAAYECAARALTSALVSFDGDQEAFQVSLFRSLVGSCRKTRVIPRGDAAFDALPPQNRAQFELVKNGLQGLDFESRALVLLRDQLRLPYRLTGMVLGIAESEARSRTLRAKGMLREKIAEVLEHG